MVSGKEKSAIKLDPFGSIEALHSGCTSRLLESSLVRSLSSTSAMVLYCYVSGRDILAAIVGSLLGQVPELQRTVRSSRHPPLWLLFGSSLSIIPPSCVFAHSRDMRTVSYKALYLFLLTHP